MSSNSPTQSIFTQLDLETKCLLFDRCASKADTWGLIDRFKLRLLNKWWKHRFEQKLITDIILTNEEDLNVIEPPLSLVENIKLNFICTPENFEKLIQVAPNLKILRLKWWGCIEVLAEIMPSIPCLQNLEVQIEFGRIHLIHEVVQTCAQQISKLLTNGTLILIFDLLFLHEEEILALDHISSLCNVRFRLKINPNWHLSALQKLPNLQCLQQLDICLDVPLNIISSLLQKAPNIQKVTFIRNISCHKSYPPNFFASIKMKWCIDNDDDDNNNSIGQNDSNGNSYHGNNCFALYPTQCYPGDKSVSGAEFARVQILFNPSLPNDVPYNPLLSNPFLMFRCVKHLHLDLNDVVTTWILCISKLSGLQRLELGTNEILESEMQVLTDLQYLKKLEITGQFVFENKGVLGAFKSLEVVCIINCSIHGRLDTWYTEMCNIYNLRYLDLVFSHMDKDATWFVTVKLNLLLPHVTKFISTENRT